MLSAPMSVTSTTSTKNSRISSFFAKTRPQRSSSVASSLESLESRSIPVNLNSELLDEDGLPSYSYAATHPTTYRFKQTSPFAMTVSSVDGASSQTVYHISVGVNVWMPSSSLTFIRRNASEDSPIVAQLEMGIVASSATLNVGDEIIPLNQVIYSKGSSSSSRYHSIGDGRTVKWKLGSSSWEAYMGSTLLCTFTPDPQSQQLLLQPEGHALMDQIVIALLVLMREHLTPKRAQIGEAARLFNYRPYDVPEE